MNTWVGVRWKDYENMYFRNNHKKTNKLIIVYINSSTLLFLFKSTSRIFKTEDTIVKTVAFSIIYDMLFMMTDCN